MQTPETQNTSANSSSKYAQTLAELKEHNLGGIFVEFYASELNKKKFNAIVSRLPEGQSTRILQLQQDYNALHILAKNILYQASTISDPLVQAQVIARLLEQFDVAVFERFQKNANHLLNAYKAATSKTGETPTAAKQRVIDAFDGFDLDSFSVRGVQWLLKYPLFAKELQAQKNSSIVSELNASFKTLSEKANNSTRVIGNLVKFATELKPLSGGNLSKLRISAFFDHASTPVINEAMVDLVQDINQLAKIANINEQAEFKKIIATQIAELMQAFNHKLISQCHHIAKGKLPNVADLKQLLANISALAQMEHELQPVNDLMRNMAKDVLVNIENIQKLAENHAHISLEINAIKADIAKSTTLLYAKYNVNKAEVQKFVVQAGQHSPRASLAPENHDQSVLSAKAAQLQKLEGGKLTKFKISKISAFFGHASTQVLNDAMQDLQAEIEKLALAKDSRASAEQVSVIQTHALSLMEGVQHKLNDHFRNMSNKAVNHNDIEKLLANLSALADIYQLSGGKDPNFKIILNLIIGDLKQVENASLAKRIDQSINNLKTYVPQYIEPTLLIDNSQSEEKTLLVELKNRYSELLKMRNINSLHYAQAMPALLKEVDQQVIKHPSYLEIVRFKQQLLDATLSPAMAIPKPPEHKPPAPPSASIEQQAQAAKRALPPMPDQVVAKRAPAPPPRPPRSN